MDQAVRVAVVRSDRRREAVAGALALIADDVRAVVRPDVLIKPNLVSHRSQRPSTHAETLSAALDALLAAGAERLVVAEGASDASAGFERMGFRREALGRPVRFLDLNREEVDWEPLGLLSVDGKALQARLSKTVAASACRVSLALAKTHVTAGLTFGLKNMLSSLHPDDRIMMHGYPGGGGNGFRGWKGAVVGLLKRDDPVVQTLTRVLGRARSARAWASGKSGADGWRRLSPADRAFLRSVAAMHRNLAALTGRVRPHLSVVDGFVAMHREGPRHGTPIRLGTVVAGTDAVAVDAVAAALMGFDPRRVGYLCHAEAAGLGVADLDAIEVVGDPIARVGRRCVPHSNDYVHRHWHRLPGPDASALLDGAHPTVPCPHARVQADREVAAR